MGIIKRKINKSDYELRIVDKVTCPNGHKNIKFLTNDKPNSPSFYICFECGYVGEIAVGAVDNRATPVKSKGKNILIDEAYLLLGDNGEKI